MQYIRMLLLVSALALPMAAHNACAFVVDDRSDNSPNASNFTDPDDNSDGGLGVHYNMTGSGQQPASQSGLSLYQGNGASNAFGNSPSWNPSATSRVR